MTHNKLAANEQWVVSGSRDGTIKVWDFDTFSCKHTLAIETTPGNHPLLTTCMVLKRNILLSVNTDVYVRVWDLNAGELLHKLESHTDPVNCVSFYRDYAVSSSDDGTVKLWNVRTGEHMRDLVRLNDGDGDGEGVGGGSIGGGGPAGAARSVVAWRFLHSPCYLVLAAGGRDDAPDGHTDETTRIYALDFSQALANPGTPVITSPPKAAREEELLRSLGKTP